MLLSAVPLLGACSKDKTPQSEVSANELTAEQKAIALFDDAMVFLEDEGYSKAIENFEEIERLYPYTGVASSSSLMIALAYYKDEEYDDSIENLERFISLHPGNERISYAYYLKAMAYYDRMTDVKRDQYITEKAKLALDELVRRFPKSGYAKDARLKLDLVRDHLAGKEMEIGRFYLKKGKWIAAINRFKIVVDQYDKTTHVQEALYRLTEAYVSLGVLDQAKKYASLLGHNHPDSKWYFSAYRILEKK